LSPFQPLNPNGQAFQNFFIRGNQNQPSGVFPQKRQMIKMFFVKGMVLLIAVWIDISNRKK
jgi:hypothetical protein